MNIGLKGMNVPKFGQKFIHHGASLGQKYSAVAERIAPVVGLALPEAGVALGAAGAIGEGLSNILEKASRKK